MEKCRVVFLSPTSTSGGGAERVLFDHVRFLDRDRYEPFVAVLGSGTFADEARAMGVPTYVAEPHSDSQPLSLAREIRRFGDFVKQQRIDVVVGNKYRSILYWGLSAARRRPFVWLLHDPLAERGLGRRLIARVVDRLRPSWTVWVTPEASESYVRRFPHLLGPNQSQINPGTSPEDLERDANAARARERWKIPEHAPVLSMFARMQASKGHLDLVRAAPQVLAEFPEARFLMCGGTLPGMPTDHEARVREAVQSGGLQDRVLFLGMISEQEKRDVLAATTILVHPAQWEPFGIAVIEGMAVGKPVVVANAPGPSFIVDHGTTGLIVPKGDAAAMAQAIVSLLRDPARAAAMGVAGARCVAERHHARVAARRLEDIFERVTTVAPLAETSHATT
jgi:glycosyltransferase involved in cell wall biosynthesis